MPEMKKLTIGENTYDVVDAVSRGQLSAVQTDLASVQTSLSEVEDAVRDIQENGSGAGIGAGSTTDEGGAIFGDLENNQAGALAAAFGSETKALGEASFVTGTKIDASGAPDEPWGDGIDYWRYNEAVGKGSVASGMGSVAFAKASKALGYRTQTGYPKEADKGKYPEGRQADGKAGGKGYIHAPSTMDSSSKGRVESGDYGQAAMAIGSDTLAASNNSFAGGVKSKALGNQSLAFGHTCESRFNGDIAFGDHSIAAGGKAFATGSYSKAQSQNSFAGGYNSSTAANDAAKCSFAYGDNAYANNTCAVALGNNVIASGVCSFAVGSGSDVTDYATKASGYNSISMGNMAKATSDNAVAIGNCAVAGTNGAHTDSNAIAIGYKAKADLQHCLALGSNAEALGAFSVAIGVHGENIDSPHTTANGNYSVAIGAEANTVGKYAVAIGRGAIGEGEASFAAGRSAKAQSYASTAFGCGTIAYGAYTTALGIYNAQSSNYLLSVGNGSSDTDRKNAFVVDKDNNATVTNNLYAGGTVYANNKEVATKEYVDNINPKKTDGIYIPNAQAGSISIGYNCSASPYSVAIGCTSKATGDFATALDGGTATGAHSFAVSNNTASANYSSAFGFHTKATGAAQTVVGQYNDSNDSDSLFVVGNGSSETNRNNAFTVMKNGGIILSNGCYGDALPNTGVTGQIFFLKTT